MPNSTLRIPTSSLSLFEATDDACGYCLDSSPVIEEARAFYAAYNIGLSWERIQGYTAHQTSLAMACVLDTLPPSQLLVAKIAHNLI